MFCHVGQLVDSIVVAARLFFPTRSSGRKTADHRSFRRSFSTAPAGPYTPIILEPNAGREVCSFHSEYYSNAVTILWHSAHHSGIFQISQCFFLSRIGDDGVSILGHEISFATLLAA